MKNTNSATKKNPSPSKFRIFLGTTFCLIGILSAIAFTYYLFNWKESQSQAGNMLDNSIKSSNGIGKLGDWLGNVFIFDSIGISAYILSFLMFVFGTLILKRRYFRPWKTIGHSLFFICWTPIFFGAITKGESVICGVYGYQIMDFLSAIIGSIGMWAILIFSIILYFVLEFNLRPSAVQSRFQSIKEKTMAGVESILPKEKEYNSNEEFEADKDLVNLANDGNEIPTEERKIEPVTLTPEHKVETEEKVATQPLDIEVSIPQSTDNLIIKDKKEENANSTIINLDVEKSELPIDISDAKTPEKDNIEIDIQNTDNENHSIINNPEQVSEQLVEKYGLYDHKLELANFKLPPIELLKDYGNEEISINKEELEENKNRIVGLLKNFNVGIAQIKATIGPTVTLYEIVPEAGIRVAAIKKLQDDIALNLSALGIRIIAPMPGKGTIGIEVPRKNPTMVSMRSVIASQKFQNSDMDLPVVFGKTISNEIFMADLAKMPHLLMAGATGQGKSVGINAILASLLYKKHPSELKFVMVDPKKVELSLYSKIERHYLAKLPDTEEAILTDNSKVINTLNSLCVEMDTRYELLKNAFCRNLKEYNQKFKERKLNPENGHRYLPYIVLVVDEFADLIMTAGKEVEHPIARLAQLARAVGIHLIVATQRPSVNVITGMIKANFPARVSFRVNASVDSRTILDTTGADQLIGKGDMLFSNGNDLTRVQCAFIDTPEVEKIADFIGEQKGYASAFILPEVASEDGNSVAGTLDPNEKDALFEEAARIVVGTQQGSTSMLQRQLKLGYNRAGRIMDQLEAAGIVGGFNGAKAREVLITDLMSLEQFLEDLRK